MTVDRPTADTITDDQIDALHARLAAAERILGEYVNLAEITHKYRSMGGHDTVGAGLTCAGCALVADARAHLGVQR
jgi:hypothetical protein